MKQDFHKQNINQFIRKTIVTFLMVLISAGNVLGIAPKGTKIGALQFDSIIELNAPSPKTHVLLFVRYIVSSDFYSASIIWAEPHTGSLNYPIYPPTTIIDSNEKSFSINNDIHTQYNSISSKPIGDRGVFRYMFNDYPIGNIRFAETEAHANRVYSYDLARLSEPNNNDWQTIKIPENENAIKREVSSLNIQAKDGRINAMKLLDSKEQPIKSIEYEYSKKEDSYVLSKQNIVLAERPLIVGYQSGGIKLKINGQERMIKEIISVQHAGTRKCTVDYESKKIGGKLLSLPVKVVVYSPEGKNVLRSSRLMNFKQVELNPDSTGKLSKEFASFDDNERQVREMLLKYWMENPDKIEKEDLENIRRMQKYFGNVSVAENFAGEQLRRVNMLLQLDWILGDSDQLQKHYKKYLNILKTSNLEQMILVGSQQAIETTFRWGYFPVADELLKQWIETVISLNDNEALINFAAHLIDKDRYWETIKLLEKSLEQSQIRGQKLLRTEFFRCMALYGLYEMLQNQEKIESDRKKAQINWVLSNTSDNDLLKTLRQSVSEAQKAFSSIKDPDKETAALKKQFNEINKKIVQLD